MNIMDVQTLIDDGWTVLTPNRRLARRLAQAHAERRLAAGALAWESPRLLTWRVWLRQCWDDPRLAGRPALLAPLQAAALWAEIIGGDSTTLLLPGGAATTASEAWALAHAWRVDLDAPEFGDDGDSRAFRRWARAYRARCERDGWIDEARLADAVADGLAQGALAPPPRLALYAFDELAPQQVALLDALAAAGSDIAQLAPPPAAGQAWRTDPPTFADELHAAASWARAALAADPGLRVGVVVPDLAAARARVARTFDGVLAPRRLLPDGAAGPRPFELSLGPPLAARPQVHGALALLEGLLPGPRPFVLLSALLRSPHLGAGEADARARAELELRDAGRADWPLDAVLQRIKPHAPAWVGRLLAARQALGPGAGGRTPGAWAARVATTLAAAGWPGDATLDSTGHQAVAAWHELLADYARLEAVGLRHGVEELVAQLGRLARERVFQPAGHGAQVQVLGLLEAAGQRFDRLWICGLDDTAWPPPARPNPFLPGRLRRRLGLPRSTPEREAEVAQRLTAAFAVAADQVVFSHARRDGDAELAVSPLLAALPRVEVAELLEQAAPRPAALFAGAPLERFVDEVAPPLPPGRLRGGAARVGDQSACPFRALAHHRLGAEPLAAPAQGLDALARGNLVHHALQRLWEGEGDGVARLAPERRRAAVTLACAHAIVRAGERLGDRPRLRAIEQARLVELVERWLDVDAARPPAAACAVEEKIEARFGDHELRLKIDRIDTLADGRLAIVDYKTSQKLAPGDWEGERPQAPQLPLYAAALGAERVAALAYGKVHIEGCRYIGVAADDGLLPGVRGLGAEAAAGFIDGAAAAAERLLRQHVAGAAAVDPLDQACTYCGLQPLCRVLEREDGARSGDDDD